MSTNAEQKTKPRIGMDYEDMVELFNILEDQEILSKRMSDLQGKLKLNIFKLQEGLPVSGYLVLKNKRGSKYSLSNLGFGEIESKSAAVVDMGLPDPKKNKDAFNEAFMNKMDARLRGETNNDQSSTE